jgi:four helix bundle protein
MSIIPLHAALIRGVCRYRDGLCRSGVARISGKGVVRFFGTHSLRRFAAQVVRLCQTFPKGPAAKHILGQLVRAATGGGANYEEARGAESRADFIHKVGVANKEMREALYWLRLVQDADLVVSDDVDALVREADELIAILTASIKTAKQREVTSCGEARSWRTRDGGVPGSWYPFAPSE